MHVYFLESCEKSVVVLGFLESFSNSLSESGERFSGFLSLSPLGGLGLGFGGFLLLGCGLGFLGFFFLGFFFLWFFFFGLRFLGIFLLGLLLGFLLLGGLGFRRGRSFWFLSVSVDIEERLADIKIVTRGNVELRNDTCTGALNLNSDLVGLDIGDSLILINPVTFL